MVSATSAADAASSLAPSPTVSDSPVSSVARIPLAGGPEFTQPDDAYICGDLAPGILPAERNLVVAVSADDGSVHMPSAAVGLSMDLTYQGASDAGTATVGEIALLLVRDGRIAGTIRNVDSQLDWPLIPGASIQSGAGVFADFFQCKRRSAEGQHKYFDTTVAPGDYQLVARARVFSTEESVALAQAVPPWYQLDESRREPGGIYAPGSYDCTRLEATATTVRGCLPNVAPAATLDNGRGSISVRYDPAALVAPFETTLVSKQVSVTLGAWKDTEKGRIAQARLSQKSLGFTSVDDVVCDATVNDLSLAADSNDGVEVQSRLPDISTLQTGTYGAEVMPWLAPNGSSVRLESGARLAYLLQRETTDADSPLPVYEVVGFAPVALEGVLPYDRYRGPTAVELTVGAPDLCPGAGNKSVRLSENPLLVGTWVVTAPNGTQTRHGVVSTTWPSSQ